MARKRTTKATVESAKPKAPTETKRGRRPKAAAAAPVRAARSPARDVGKSSGTVTGSLKARKYTRRTPKEILQILAHVKLLERGELQPYLRGIGATKSNLWQWRQKYA